MSILIVEPSARYAEQLARALRASGHASVLVAHSAGQALTTLTRAGEEASGPEAGERVELMLMDVVMPDLDGVALCRALRATPDLGDIPVIMMSDSHTNGRLPEAFDAGAFDYVVKPCRRVELLARVRAAHRFGQELRARKEREARLAEINKELERLSIEDGLTGLANRRRFDAVFEHEFRRASRNGTPLAVGLGDVDHFKGYNDSKGHPAGDACLRAVGAAIRETLQRPADLAARYGGEEFGFVLPETTPEGALFIAEKIRRSVEALGLEHPASGVGPVVTISIGVCAAARASTSPFEMLTAADRLLYDAKREGRNRVRLGPETPAALAA